MNGYPGESKLVSRGQALSIATHLVLKLPSRLQALHGQQVVCEVHVRGHLQERTLWVHSRNAGQELLHIIHDFRADRKQEEKSVVL